MSTTDALGERVRETWAMLARADDPMPAWAALDFVQELTDDRGRAFLALCAHAGGLMAEAHVGILQYDHAEDGTGTGGLPSVVAAGRLDEAWDRVDFIKSHENDPDGQSVGKAWGTYWRYWVRVDDLLRALEAAR